MEIALFNEYVLRVKNLFNRVPNWFNEDESIIADYLRENTSFGYGRVLYLFLKPAYQAYSKSPYKKYSGPLLNQLSTSLYNSQKEKEYRLIAFIFVFDVLFAALDLVSTEVLPLAAINDINFIEEQSLINDNAPELETPESKKIKELELEKQKLVSENYMLKHKVKQKARKKAIVISIVSCSALLILAAILIPIISVNAYKEAHAGENYDSLVYEMQHFSGYTGKMEDLIKALPSKYKDVPTIKKELDTLKGYLKDTDSYTRFWNIWNFDADKDNWDCRDYYWSYSLYPLVFNYYWENTEEGYYFHWYKDKTDGKNYLLNYLPNNKESDKTYYYNYRFVNTNNKNYSINQSVIFGFESADDKNDNFDAYQLRNIWVDTKGQKTIDVYCYSNQTTYRLTLNYGKSKQ